MRFFSVVLVLSAINIACSSGDKKKGTNAPATNGNPETPVPTILPPTTPHFEDIIVPGEKLTCKSDGYFFSNCRVIESESLLAERQQAVTEFSIHYTFVCRYAEIDLGVKSDQQEIVLKKTDASGATVQIFGLGPITLASLNPMATDYRKVAPSCAFSIDQVSYGKVHN